MLLTLHNLRVFISLVFYYQKCTLSFLSFCRLIIPLMTACQSRSEIVNRRKRVRDLAVFYQTLETGDVIVVYGSGSEISEYSNALIIRIKSELSKTVPTSRMIFRSLPEHQFANSVEKKKSIHIVSK